MGGGRGLVGAGEYKLMSSFFSRYFKRRIDIFLDFVPKVHVHVYTHKVCLYSQVCVCVCVYGTERERQMCLTDFAISVAMAGSVSAVHIWLAGFPRVLQVVPILCRPRRGVCVWSMSQSVSS